jgi:glycosyltransferase involved in cell wall biosynthesis
LKNDRFTAVSIGMPVYNGAAFVAQAIESILAQTPGDLELVISDNASTDATEEICRAFAARDLRVRYDRLPHNVGAMANYARVYDMCAGGGRYFKWAAHDDVLEPSFIEACTLALDEDPGAVLAYPRARFIDAQGRHLRDYDVKLATDAPQAWRRFEAIARAPHKRTHNLEIFGLMRRSATDRIPQQGGHAASDRVFLARLAMYGRFVEVPEVLFLSRDHAEQSIKTLPEHLRRRRSRLSRLIGHGQLPPAEWFDPRCKGRVTFPEWRLAWEYLRSVQYGDDVPVSQRARVALSVVKRQVTHNNWARMARDFLMATDLIVTRLVDKLSDDLAPRAHPNLRT